ncbi:MAG: hypothetical protein ACUVUC_08065 [Thermoguttaceae bacterium]
MTGPLDSCAAGHGPDRRGLARWIICERTGRWALALRRQPAALGLPIYQTRSLADCWEMLQQFPWSFVVIELDPRHLEALLARLARSERDYPMARMAIVAERSLAGYEWLMREAGAVWFTSSPREAAPLAAMARRHLAQVPAPVLSTLQRIWASLPWGKPDD